jgi:two-component system response regulator MprA
MHLAHSGATTIPMAGWVLVADDDPAVRETLHWILHEEGYGVCEAEDGVQALAQLWASERPLVALLDYWMPRMTGGAVLLTATNDPHLADRHAWVLLTSDCDRLPPALSRLAAQRGIPIVGKPFDLDALLAVVAEATQRLRGGAVRTLVVSGPRSAPER